MANFFKASTKKHTLGQKLKVAIERLDLNGCGVARYQNKPVFIAGALPGETVQIQIYEQKSKYLRARLLKLDNESQHRVVPFCQHYQKCGGCDLQHLAYQQQLSFKENKLAQLFARNQIKINLPWQPPLLAGEQHYRRKARIGVQYAKDGRATIGFRQRATNDLVAIAYCPVLEQPISAIFAPLKALMKKMTTSRAIGHIEVIITEQVTLIIRRLKTFTQADESLWLQQAQEHNWQVIFDTGEVLQPLTRETSLNYVLPDDLTVTFSGQDFIQVNHQMNMLMIEQAINWLSPAKNNTVLDLFCGLGNFSLPLATRVKALVGIEGIQCMVDRASENAVNNGISNCHFYQADLNSPWLEQSWAKQSYDIVVLDPARAGAFAAIEQLIKLKINKLLYVSCDPATLARDSQLLLQHGYRIEKIAIMDMFSQTKHIETMVLFSYQ